MVAALGSLGCVAATGEAATGPVVAVAPELGPVAEPPGLPPEQAPAPSSGSGDAGLAQLTGGAGNKVVASFDQLREAVRRGQRSIDDCYRSTASASGWRENLQWNLDVAADGRVTAVRLVEAEYWRAGRVVPAAPSVDLAACMRRALGQLVIAQPVQAGSVRLRFEL